LAWFISAVGAALFWHTTARGKFLIWNDLLAKVSLSDPARVLDLGCGHGTVSVMVALHFQASDVTGIDLWRSRDQSRNTPDAAKRNAERNGVADRIRFDTGDMVALPYPNATFDLVTASMAIHNIPTFAGRQKAIEEAVRVLAPGGRILIVDIVRTKEFATHLISAGLSVTGPTALGWLGWWSGPWVATKLISGTRD